jgi:glycosyltransferase involved in cell wall biosynthesis
MKKSPELSIVLPCRNEEKALPSCLKQVKQVIKNNNINAEIIVSDSSTDKSPEIAKRHRVVLVKHDLEGYGNAYLKGFEQAKGEYIFMADADCTYDFSYIPVFLKYLRQGYDFVIGNRFSGQMEKKSMTFSHRYIGNPVLSWVLRLFFRTKIKDSHCGMRAISKKALDILNLQTTGMEFASEMIMKALNYNLKIKEVPISYKERIGKSKLKTLSDGWRHLRFMLLYSPVFLFFIPGFIFFLLGLDSMIWFYFGNPKIFGVQFYTHPMFLSSLLLIIGYQLMFFAIFAKTYAITHLKEKNDFFEKLYKRISIEKASIAGLIVIVLGIVLFLWILIKWIKSGFGSLQEVKNAIVALTLTVLGLQTIFSAFMLSILGIREK